MALEYLQVEMPRCKHVMVVPCGMKLEVAERPDACAQPMPVMMPLCGHTLTVRCMYTYATSLRCGAAGSI